MQEGLRENFRRSFYHSHLRSVSLILESGDPSYTAIASFCLPGNGGFDTTVSPAFVSGKAVALVAPFLRRLLLRSSFFEIYSFIGFGLHGGVESRFVLNPAEAVVVFWRISD
ncbi:hypothetical protein HID58_039547 [Brassica napus]|uniref:Uncharacterized protein n=1 Tax=Brassica napus TaxID=3708 RepID=A0ABQ8BU22_BRANA|nr:hypothetical protein HID58_039547 [Brassica napus]